MSNDRMILVLCLIISIIALIIGSVALSRDDRQHTIIEYDDSSTNSTSEKSLYSVALPEKKYWERFFYDSLINFAHHIIPPYQEKEANFMKEQPRKYIKINNDYQIHSFDASHHSPNFYISVDGMPSRFHNSFNTYVVSEIQIKNFYFGTIKGTQTRKGKEDIDIHGPHYYWTVSVDPRNTSVEINKVGEFWVCVWDLKQQ